MGTLHRFPNATAPVERVLSRFDREQIEGFIEVAIGLLDLADGDPDLEDDDPDEENDGSEPEQAL